MKSPSDLLTDERLIYLISDLHLEVGRPETTALLLDFLSGPARRARSLYILGDLFDAWIGDDGADELANQLASALHALAESGTAVHFLHGNRDFLLGRQYCQRAGMSLLDEPVLLAQAKPSTALLHGDVLCSEDHEYQRFRQKVRQADWQARMLARPLWLRRLLAQVARAISRSRNRRKTAAIMDVSEAEVRACFRDLGVQRLIHGHTHRPAVHCMEIEGRLCERIVLGDWHGETGSVLQLLDDQASLLSLSRDRDGQLLLLPA